MAAATRIAITAFDAALGADVSGIDLRSAISAEDAAALKQAWTQHLVLRFRDLPALTPDALIAFSRLFGDLDHRPVASGAKSRYFEVDRPEITIISNVVVDGKPVGGLGSYEAVWHADMTYVAAPPMGSCLYAVELPPSGGDTHFANMYLAYETLDEPTRKRIAGLTCVHDASRNSAGELRNGYEDITDPRRTVGAEHPLVRVHPQSGRKCLMLGRRRNAYIKGCTLEDSEALLDRLWEHATRPELTWAQSWRLGDMVMWDNRCTMHRRDAFDAASRRLMLRTQISGEAVIAA